jgi:hypothetical protein
MTITTIYETTGANTLTVTTLNGQSLNFFGNTISPMYSIVEDSIRTLTDEEFALLKQEISANISPQVQSFTITNGPTFTVDGWDSVSYNGEFISNIYNQGSI